MTLTMSLMDAVIMLETVTVTCAVINGVYGHENNDECDGNDNIIYGYSSSVPFRIMIK